MAAALLLPWAQKAGAAPDSVVTFNEIHYHPPDPVPPAVASPEWLELHNQMSIRVDLGGWSLGGGISYTFPEGTVMEPGSFLVVSALAENPPGALGPFTGRLDNAGEEIRLHERWGRMMDRIEYGDSGSWPAEADGGGPTLAKRHGDLGSEAAVSWAVSSSVGGTPGTENSGPSAESTPRPIFTTGSNWKYEPSGADPGGDWYQPSGFSDAAWIDGTAPLASNPADSPATLLPPGRTAWHFRKLFAWSGTLPNPHLLLTGSLDGKVECWLNGSPVPTNPPHPAGGFLISASNILPGANLLAIKLTPRTAGGNVLLDLQATLLDGITGVAPALPPALQGQVVINEIAYHAPPVYPDPAAGISWQENPDEWIELHNPGQTTVDLSGWRLSDAIDYTFPAGTLLAAEGFLVVGQTQFDGSLANRGERIRLRDATDQLVDEVPWLDGGRWPKAADGGGSTLELIDPRADRRRPESWAASSESARTQWQTISYRATGAEPPGSNNPDNWREFLMGFLDEGEALIDDVSVIEDPDGARLQLIQNGTFETDAIGSPASKWRLAGTHKNSRVAAHPDGAGKVLHLTATGESDHTYNNASTTLNGNRFISSGRTYEISYKAKWLTGSPQLNSRLYLNRAARTVILTQPGIRGTPGAANSLRAPNTGPAAEGLRHRPLVPAATQPVTISVSLTDPDGIQEAVLFHRVNQGTWQQTPMGGDHAGRFFAVLPGQAVNAQVQFYVRATDSAGALTDFPAGGPESRALYKVGDGGISTQPVRNKMRLLMHPSDAAELHNPIHGVSNFRWPCTVIYNDREVWYDARVRLRSAPFGRQGVRAGWNIQFPPDRPFRGVQSSIVIDGAFNMPRGDGSGWLENSLGPSVNEMLYQAIANRAGNIPATYDDVVYFQTPRPAEGNRRAQLKMTRFNPSYLEEAFENGAEGTLFKQELIYYPTSTVDGNPESLKNGFSQVRDTEIRSFGSSKEGWRWNYLIQTNSRQDDYSRIMDLGKAFDSSSANLATATNGVIDPDNWMRVFALTALTGLADTYNNGLAHNIQLYVRPTDRKVLLFPWDQDHAFYYAPNSSIYGSGTHRLAAVINLPQNRRLFAGHLRHLCQTAFTNAFLDPVINHLSSFPVADKTVHASSLRSWVAARRSFVLAQINSTFPNVPFAITTNNGNPLETTQPSVTLTGNGWIDVHRIMVSRNGSPAQPAPVRWLTSRTWEMTVPVLSGINAMVLTAVDHDGTTTGTSSLTITQTGSVEPAAASNLVISEVHYHPEIATDAEFIELWNIGSKPIDLTGVRFTEGILFSFTGSAITILTPGQRVLVVSDPSTFSSRYGSGLPVAGAFENDTALANSGEALLLLDRANSPIASFSYHDQPPWPEEADGHGPSLTLIRPDLKPDPSKPANWRLSAAAGGSPGSSDSFSATKFSSLAEYVFTELPAIAPAEAGKIQLTWSLRSGADDALVFPEISTNLTQWTPVTPEGGGWEFQPAGVPATMGSRKINVLIPAPDRQLHFRFRLVPRQD